MAYYVYILTNKPHGVLYTGMSNDLIRRVWEHKTEAVKGFTQKYHLHRLVWFEVHPSAENALTREWSIKRWRRAWKETLIETMNPEWQDLYQGLC